MIFSCPVPAWPGQFHSMSSLLKRALAECGELTLSQLAKEVDMTPVSVASALEQNPRHFYSRKEGGVVLWSLSY